MTRSRRRLSAGHEPRRRIPVARPGLGQRADYGSALARLCSANAEVAADQGEVDRLNALEAFEPSAKKLVVFIPAANY
jgi:hypothetical protein